MTLFHAGKLYTGTSFMNIDVITTIIPRYIMIYKCIAIYLPQLLAGVTP